MSGILKKIKAFLLSCAQDVGGEAYGKYARWHDGLWLIIPIAGYSFCLAAMWARKREEYRKRL